MANWKEMIDEEAGNDKIIACTLSDDELIVEFNNGFGESEGKPFTAWGEKYVYFPVVYDGSEWVGKAPRNPCDEATDHMGGEWVSNVLITRRHKRSAVNLFGKRRRDEINRI